MTQFNADNAFTKADEILEIYEKEDIKHVIIDFHREATSEVQAMAAYLDGRVSVVF
jgi:calcineurin-like phosphoesterase